MRLDYLNELPARGLSFDVETYLIRAGLLNPPLVLAAAGYVQDGKIATECVGKQQALELHALLLDDPERIEVGANLAYDNLVLATEFAKLGIDVMPELFAAYESGRVYDIQVAEMLDAIAEGCLGNDPRTSAPLVGPDTGRRAGYSLAMVLDLTTGIKDAKALGHMATQYEQYDNVPIELLPPEARDYPQDDVRNALHAALVQTGHVPRGGAHKWGARTECEWCGVHPKNAYVEGKYLPCVARRRSRNLHDLANQTYTAWAMHLGAARGFRVNQASVDKIEADALDGRTEAEQPFVEARLLKRNRDGSTSRDMAAIAAAVALAYGADPGKCCTTCNGTRKVISAKAKLVKCPLCKQRAAAGIVVADCQQCGGRGEIPDPRQLVNCTVCASTGFDLSVAPNVPKTETGRIGTGRDVLNESGDETLMGLADHQEGAKVLEVYVPWLRRARRPVAGHAEGCPTRSDGGCTCSGPYEDIALTLWPNVLLETGRTSYRGVVQLFPRAGGHRDKRGERIPSLRECIEARPGFIFSSEDFKSGELYTHGQSCIWICGHSDLANALLKDIDPHSALAATVLGVSYEEFIKRKKEPAFKNARQAAKPFTFGKPGGMGSSKLVLQQRKQGPDTPCAGGPAMIDDGSGNKVPGYKGLRFCILMDGAAACGIERVTKWGKRGQDIPPTCRHCLECADRLGNKWLTQWSENEKYFSYINDCVEHGQLITESHLELWPHLRDWFAPNVRLAPGEVMQHVSGRVRGGVDFCSAANGFFQGLLSDISKAALRRVAHECWDRTVRVPAFAHPNSRASAYAGGPSPLFGSYFIGFFHDELFLEHPESVAHDGATRVSEIMAEEMAWYCPDVAATCGAEPTLMRMWNKAAEKIVDSNGRLIPWEPK